MAITGVERSRRFARDFRSLPEEIQRAVGSAIADLFKDPIPQSRRCHRLQGYKPTILAVDVFPNHSWQITFTLDGQKAILLRVATHREIDRAPR